MDRVKLCHGLRNLDNLPIGKGNGVNFEDIFNEFKKEAEPEYEASECAEAPPEFETELFNKANPELLRSPIFLKLKERMSKFYKEVQERAHDKTYLYQNLKNNLYETLIKLIRGIIYTRNLEDQYKYLLRVYDWFAKRERLQKSRVKHYYKTQSKYQFPPEQFIELTSKTLYDTKKRTIHSNISPPKLRLAELKHKLIIPKKEKAKEVKNGPSIEAGSTFLYYVPKDPREQKAEAMWLERKNKALADKRTETEFRESINQWGLTKARFNEELIKKHENTTYSNNFAIRSHKRSRTNKKVRKHKKDYKKMYDEKSSDEDESKVSQTKSCIKKPELIDLSKKLDYTTTLFPDVTKVIQESDIRKINHIKKLYGPLINQTQDREEYEDYKRSLSVYNKYAKRIPDIHKTRNLSERTLPITHIGTRDQFRIHQGKEINVLKTVLSREDVPCTLQALHRAIVIPHDYCRSKSIPKCFPTPGSRLIVNPFVVKKREKKKEV